MLLNNNSYYCLLRQPVLFLAVSVHIFDCASIRAQLKSYLIGNSCNLIVLRVGRNPGSDALFNCDGLKLTTFNTSRSQCASNVSLDLRVVGHKRLCIFNPQPQFAYSLWTFHAASGKTKGSV